MPQYKIFIVDDDTWKEHNQVGIAAINDPLTTHPTNRNANAARQSALSEISGIKPGDVLFFNRMASNVHPPEILGIYEATSKPYFNPAPLFSGSKFVNKNLPFRVDFKCLHNFPNPILLEEIWALKDKGKIWTLQQSRGDAVGVHACMGIAKIEAKIIERLFKINNVIEKPIPKYKKSQVNRQNLPWDFKTDKEGVLHYEATLLSILLEDFADGKHREIFGDYDDFIPHLPTGSRKEIDILLIKYNCDDILWFQVLELKRDKFTMYDLQKLINYDKWLIKTKAENPLQVYPVAIAADFNVQVKEYVKHSKDYLERPIKLIKYYFDYKSKTISLSEIY